ncbi:TPR-like protein [Ascobolus immersus RN42]|uniref:TPR-like protein n=1 Tax=Ascobolus immersus RN42 TaxID=1160509 RepID=A0A3N4ILM8_ASCIM|nr:TPR-like protein [Ascobolus immersus RN42]
MADYGYGGSGGDDKAEFAEYEKLNQAVIEDSDDFEAWENLIKCVETLENGGLNRNSSPAAIEKYRDAYDRMLRKFPLLFGYWKKYADLEFSIAGTEAAEMVYERGVSSITNSVDLWTNYCAFKVETSHEPDNIRELFERGATCVGLDFLSHPFWDKYIEFEERMEAYDKIFAILDRVVHIPMHQYARYFERFRQLASTRPLEELLPIDTLNQFRQEVLAESPNTVQAGQQQIKMERGELEIEREIRLRIDSFHLEIFARTQTETTKRWTYEAEIKRPYFHVTELDEAQLVNWRKYLDFEEVEGDFARIQFLYERCLVTCAFYDEFWYRYARWMSAQPNKTEEIRQIYMRACTVFVPIGRPGIRLHYAFWEETQNRMDIANDVMESILLALPGHIETIIAWANMQRRVGGLDAAIAVYRAQIESSECDIYAKGALTAEWARLLWKVKGDVDAARQVFQKNHHWYLDSRYFWINYLMFELEQPTSSETEHTNYVRIKQVVDDIRKKSHLPPLVVKDLVHMYMVYLQERGGKDAAKEFMELDREVNGPFSIQTSNKQKLAEDGKEATTDRRLMMENGHPGVEVDESAIRRGENPYTKYYLQQGDVTGAAP